jgi:uncharacterized RmlC-like cupin family protein
MQLTRVALTYSDDAGVKVTLPKGHENTFHIMGGHSSGIYILANPRTQWGTHVDPPALGKANMLEVCIGILDGEFRRPSA